MTPEEDLARMKTLYTSLAATTRDYMTALESTANSIRIYTKTIDDTGKESKDARNALLGVRKSFGALIESAPKSLYGIIEFSKGLNKVTEQAEKAGIRIPAMEERIIAKKLGILAMGEKRELSQKEQAIEQWIIRLKGAIKSEISEKGKLAKASEKWYKDQMNKAKAYQKALSFDREINQKKEKAAILRGQGGILNNIKAQYLESFARISSGSRKMGINLGLFSKVLAGASIIVTLVIKAIEILSGAFSNTIKATKLYAFAGGMTSNVLSRASDIMRASAWSIQGSILGISESMRIATIAAESGGLSLIRYKDITHMSRKATDEMIKTVNKSAISIAIAAPFFGMVGDEAVKTMVKITKVYRMGYKGLEHNFNILGKIAVKLRIPLNSFLGLLAKIGEQFRFTGMKAGVTVTLFANLWKAGAKLNKTMKGFWENVYPEDIWKITEAAIQAASRITPETYLAYLEKPIGDIGEAWQEAVTATPIEKLSAAYKRLLPLAESTGTAAGLIGRLTMMFPGLKDMGALGLRVTQMIDQMYRSGELQRLDFKNTAAMTKLFKEKIPDMTDEQIKTLTTGFTAMEDPLKVIMNVVQTLAIGFYSFVPKLFDIIAHIPIVGKVVEKIAGTGIRQFESLRSERQLEHMTGTAKPITSGPNIGG